MIALESFTNSAIGFVVSWLATVFVLGYSPTYSIAITMLFFVLSFTRAYVLRRLFAGLSK